MQELKYKNIKLQIPYKNYENQKNESTINRLKNDRYEKEELGFILKHLKAHHTVLDLGTSIGVSSCLIGSRLSDSSNLVAVEANPDLIDTIENNRDINDLDFHVLHAPVSSVNKEVGFNYNGLSLSGSIKRKPHLASGKWGEDKTIKLKTITPIDIEEKYELKFNALSCDIEGEEFALLLDLYDYFQSFYFMVVEFHGFPEKRSLVHKKYSQNFNIEINGNTSCFSKG